MNHVARMNGWTPFVNMQCQYNLLYREEEREMIPYCTDQGIAVTAFSPLARGWLSGSKKVRSKTDFSFIEFHGDALDLEIISKVEAMASEHDATMAEVALSWVYSREAICCPIIGASSVSQLENNVKALDLELSADEVETLGPDVQATGRYQRPCSQSHAALPGRKPGVLRWNRMKSTN